MALTRRNFITGSIAASVLPFLPGCRPPVRKGAVEPEPGPASGPADMLYGHSADAVRLNKNENPFGPSPRAVDAVRGALSQAHRYVNSAQLREAIAGVHGVEPEMIRLGTGSGDVLRTIPFALIGDGGNVVATLESYRATPAMAETMGAEVRWVHLRPDWTYDTDGLLEAVDADTRIFYLVNPNNPTGTTLGHDAIASIADALPGHVMFLIDEAYFHFLPAGSKTGIDLLKAGHENVFVTRTFSKAYGLAGLRIGYGVGHPDAVARISRFMTAGTNTAAFAAALAALDDHEHVARFLEQARRSREFYEKELQALGLEYVAGSAPLILVEVGDRCEEIVDAMAEDNVFVRKGKSWGMPGHIRISFGLDSQNEAAVAALAKRLS